MSNISRTVKNSDKKIQRIKFSKPITAQEKSVELPKYSSPLNRIKNSFLFQRKGLMPEINKRPKSSKIGNNKGKKASLALMENKKNKILVNLFM